MGPEGDSVRTHCSLLSSSSSHHNGKQQCICRAGAQRAWGARFFDAGRSGPTCACVSCADAALTLNLSLITTSIVFIDGFAGHPERMSSHRGEVYCGHTNIETMARDSHEDFENFSRLRRPVNREAATRLVPRVVPNHYDPPYTGLLSGGQWLGYSIRPRTASRTD